jgi:D-alanine-D-alanine ligase
MQIGIAYNLKSDFAVLESRGPDDRLEEYDSLATVEGIERALALAGHRTRRLGGGRAFLEGLLAGGTDLVFNIAEGFGTRSREAHVPSVCEMLGVPYTHSDPLTCAMTLDKAIAKRVAASHGVPTPQFCVIESERDLPLLADPGALGLSFPLFAKPLAEGSSMGIRGSSRIEDAATLVRRTGELLRDYGQPVLLEEFCPGAEFTVGILGSGESLRVLGTMEVVPRKVAREQFVYSLDVKRDENYHEQIEYCLPPRQAPELTRCVEEIALEACRALDVRDVARVDLRVGADGEPKFLEVNPLPGLKPGWSDLAILSEKAGLAYDGLIAAIVDEARKRYGL